MFLCEVTHSDIKDTDKQEAKKCMPEYFNSKRKTLAM